MSIEIHRAEHIMEQQDIPFNPNIMVGIEPEVDVALKNILEMPEGLFAQQVMRGLDLRSKVEVGDNDLISEIVACDATQHIGTMRVIGGFLKDPEVTKTPDEEQAFLGGMDFHLFASIKGIQAAIKYQRNNDTSGLKQYLDGMRQHLNEQITMGNLPKEDQEHAHEELLQYLDLQNKIS